MVANSTEFEITGTARVANGTVGRVQVQIQDRGNNQSLQDNGTAFTTFANAANTLNATLDPGTGTTRTWRITVPATSITTNRNLLVSAQAFTAATGGSGDTTKATKRFESFSTEDQTPDDQHLRAVRRPDLDHLHGHRHRQPTTRASTP